VFGCIGAGLGGFAFFAWVISDPAPRPVPYPVVVGARIEQGGLEVALGCQPVAGSTVEVWFVPRVPLMENNSPGVDFISDGSLSVFDPFALPDDIEVITSPPDGFEWQQIERVFVSLGIPGSGRGMKGTCLWMI